MPSRGTQPSGCCASSHLLRLAKALHLHSCNRRTAAAVGAVGAAAGGAGGGRGGHEPDHVAVAGELEGEQRADRHLLDEHVAGLRVDLDRLGRGRRGGDVRHQVVVVRGEPRLVRFPRGAERDGVLPPEPAQAGRPDCDRRPVVIDRQVVHHQAVRERQRRVDGRQRVERQALVLELHSEQRAGVRRDCRLQDRHHHQRHSRGQPARLRSARHVPPTSSCCCPQRCHQPLGTKKSPFSIQTICSHHVPEPRCSRAICAYFLWRRLPRPQPHGQPPVVWCCGP